MRYNEITKNLLILEKKEQLWYLEKREETEKLKK